MWRLSGERKKPPHLLLIFAHRAGVYAGNPAQRRIETLTSGRSLNVGRQQELDLVVPAPKTEPVLPPSPGPLFERPQRRRPPTEAALLLLISPRRKFVLKEAKGTLERA